MHNRRGPSELLDRNPQAQIFQAESAYELFVHLSSIVEP